jgi:predicted alpha-1,2-mannosidase
MNRLFRFSVCFIFFNAALLAQTSFSSFVNPFCGTAAHGHTFPGATLPFGMVQLSPDTDIRGWDWCSGYHASDSSMLGFSHTHLSGTGGAALGDVLVMPGTGPLQFNPGDKKQPGTGYRSRFDHASESAAPGYYKVMLRDYGITAELTASRRAAMHRYTFPGDSGHVLVDLIHGINEKTTRSWIHVISPTKIEGMRQSSGWAENRVVYFAMEFSKPATAVLGTRDIQFYDSLTIERNAGVLGCFIFTGLQQKPLTIKVGISFVDAAGAWNNLNTEIAGQTFDQVRSAAGGAWEKELAKIQVAGKNNEERATFYTALYHSMICPNLFSDCDGRYRGMDNVIHTAQNYEHYTIFSLWDTFRAEHPLFTIIDTARAKDFVRSLLDKGKQFGVLPIWELDANETECMIGYHAVPVIADAIVKGIFPADFPGAYEAMTKAAHQDKYAIQPYNRLGYVPADKETDAVSRTLEYAYDDWCIAQVARKLGKADDYATYMSRALSYKNVFDPVTGLMRGRFLDGRWRPAFDPLEPFPLGVGDFTEGNSWQYSWFVPQNIFGLIDGMGGEQRFGNKLDSLFTLASSPKYRQLSDVTGLIGQYAHGNEPSHHTIFLYNFANQEWKTQQRARQIMHELYSSEPDGLCGNDDCGQMSAWYVFTAMGFYPVTPASLNYTWSSPLFDSVAIRLPNGKTFRLIAHDNSSENKFIRKIVIDGKPCTTPYLSHEVIVNGGLVELFMGSQSEAMHFNTKIARGEEEKSFSGILPPRHDVFVPWMENERYCFTDSVIVRLHTTTPDGIIRYTVDGSAPTPSSPVYQSPLTFSEPVHLKAVTYKLNTASDDTLSAVFTRTLFRDESRRDTVYPRITYLQPFDQEYASTGQTALIDGLLGTKRFKDHAWQGFYGNDLDVIIDLGKTTAIGRVSLSCLDDPVSWILRPDSVRIATSVDGVHYTTVSEFPVPERVSYIPEQISFSTPKIFARARYVHVFAKNRKVLPYWHNSTGRTCFIFADEILIEPARSR